MQKIAIFGDSYAVSGFTERFNYQKTWVDLLEHDFIIENFAETGCGPDFQLMKFREYFKTDRSNDIVIFVLPHHLRLFLSDTDPVEHVYSFVYLHNKIKGIGQKIKDRLKVLLDSNRNNSYEEYKKRHSLFLDLWYEKFLKVGSYLETEPLKIAALVSKYRKRCKKVILLPVHPFTEEDKMLCRENNFYISDLCLRTLDESENVDINKIKKNNGIDYRAGHMSIENHTKVFIHLKDIINGKIYS